ncbi:IS1/IS1595 family N-terminal zinc-binding domain-containing protein [Abditibacterium utsteinense]
MVVQISVCCYYSESEDVIRSGQTTNGKQRFRCKSCRRTFRESPLHSQI